MDLISQFSSAFLLLTLTLPAKHGSEPLRLFFSGKIMDLSTKTPTGFVGWEDLLRLATVALMVWEACRGSRVSPVAETE
jgi:hypothetical protein